MPLNIAQINAAKPKEKMYRLYDEKGLYLEISPAGGKLWRMKYRFAGKEKRLALGSYPEISLAVARKKCIEKRALLIENVDPAEAKKQAKFEAIADLQTFEKVARDWHKNSVEKWTPGHAARLLRGLEKDVFPYIGSRLISSISAPEVLETLRKIEGRGALETAHRELSSCTQVFKFALINGFCDRNVCTDLRGVLKPVKHAHHPSITKPAAVGELLRAIDQYKGSPVVRLALKFAPLVFVRPGELRHAEWQEVDFEKKEWRIPAEKMKARVLHIVPLSAQSLDVLYTLYPLTGSGRFLFPGRRGQARPMSENTVNAALRYLGYDKDQMTGHGFRSMASTLLNEQGWNRDWIERQLAHGEKNEVRAAYNYAEYLSERREMMQAWANYLDELRGVQKVLQFAQ